MKARVFFLVPLAVVATLFAISLWNSGAEAEDTLEPTPASTLDAPQRPAVEPVPTSIPLAQPLETREEVLDQILYYDAAWAKWEQPWSLQTQELEPDRIVVKLHASRSLESMAFGEDAWYSPEVEANAGSVWSVSIKGRVQVAVIGGNPDLVYDGVTYVISGRTGNLLTIRTGLPIDG